MKKGYTLVEVMIAVVFLAIAIAVVMGAIQSTGCGRFIGDMLR